MDTVVIGTIVRPFGIKGEMKVKVETDFVEERFKIGETVYLEIEKTMQPFIVSSARMHKGALLLGFEGYPNINDIEQFRNYKIYYKTSEVHELKDNEYYFTDLINLDVYVENEKVGTVKEIYDTPAHPVMRVIFDNDQESALVPLVKTFIKSVDLKNKMIEVNWMEGLW